MASLSVVDAGQERDGPRLKETLLLHPADEHLPYDVKFYPFTAEGSDPIFAVASSQHVLIYRVCKRTSPNAQLILHVQDDDDDVFYSMAWTKNLETGVPLLCVAGKRAVIKIIDAQTGMLHRTLIGHGGEVNDLVISPINPQILASASQDNTVRLWTLDVAHRKEPCIAVCAGDGHVDTVLSAVKAFHPTGRYVISGGQDNMVNLWSVPELPLGSIVARQPELIHYPHFSSSEVHTDIVDCVAFHGDLILSKANLEKCIVLWLIVGFNSTAAFPACLSAPPSTTKARSTRSAFSPPSAPNGSRQYMRLLQFAIPDCYSFYMRFSLFSAPSVDVTRPILAICNSRSQVFFWDLARFDEYHSYLESLKDVNSVEEGVGPHAQTPHPAWLISTSRKEKKSEALIDWRRAAEDSNAESTVTASTQHTSSTGTLMGSTGEITAGLRRKYEMGSPFAMVEAHWKESLPKSKCQVTGRQVAWSLSGTWCIVVGEPNVVAIFERRH